MPTARLRFTWRRRSWRIPPPVMFRHPAIPVTASRRPGGLRVGAVQYLNSRPLVHGLSAVGLDVRYDLPSRLADRLADGGLDVALIPAVEVFRAADYRIVSDACIGCRGPVMSVKLFFRTAPERVATLAVDEGSRTSATLARILLAERHGTHPRIETLPIGAGLADTAADAVLLIGDRAIGPAGGPQGGGSFQLVWDLGDEWCRWTGLPFVFAVWAAPARVDVAAVAPLLSRARDSGVANLASIAAAEASAHGLTLPQCLGYLRDNLHFHLGPMEHEALRLFRDKADALGLACRPQRSGPRPIVVSGGAA